MSTITKIISKMTQTTTITTMVLSVPDPFDKFCEVPSQIPETLTLSLLSPHFDETASN